MRPGASLGRQPEGPGADVALPEREGPWWNRQRGPRPPSCEPGLLVSKNQVRSLNKWPSTGTGRLWHRCPCVATANRVAGDDERLSQRECVDARDRAGSPHDCAGRDPDEATHRPRDASARRHLPVHEIRAARSPDAGAPPPTEPCQLGASGVGQVVLAARTDTEEGRVGLLVPDARKTAPLSNASPGTDNCRPALQCNQVDGVAGSPGPSVKRKGWSRVFDVATRRQAPSTVRNSSFSTVSLYTSMSG